MTSEEQFTTENDMAMRDAMLSIADQLYEGSRDVGDANLVVQEQNGFSSAIPYMEGSDLLVRDVDSTSTFTLTSSLSLPDPQSRKMAFSVIVAETEVACAPFGLASPKFKEYPQLGALSRTASTDFLEIRRRWAFNAFANTKNLGRDPHTMVTLGNRSIILYPNTPKDRIGEFFPQGNVSEELLEQIPVSSLQEHDVSRFNRIVTRLGFAGIQL